MNELIQLFNNQGMYVVLSSNLYEGNMYIEFIKDTGRIGRRLKSHEWRFYFPIDFIKVS